MTLVESCLVASPATAITLTGTASKRAFRIYLIFETPSQRNLLIRLIPDSAVHHDPSYIPTCFQRESTKS